MTNAANEYGLDLWPISNEVDEEKRPKEPVGTNRLFVLAIGALVMANISTGRRDAMAAT